MHEVSWRRVKWPRPSWVRKDLCQFVESSWVASLFRGSTFWRAVGASWKPLWGDLLGPLGGLRGLILALLQPLEPLGRAWPSWSPLGGSKVALCRKARIR